MRNKPDLSGVCQAERALLSEIAGVLGSNFANLLGLKPDQEPLRPEAGPIMKQRANAATPTARCLPAGIPGGLFIYVMLPGSGDPPRQIYRNGRALPRNPHPSWSGYSVAKWRGDTLVVQTIGFNKESWLDGFGHPRSETMRITESYTRPFAFRTQLNLIPDADVLEFVCAENEKDRLHLAKE